LVSNALWRGMQASARTLPRRCARSPVLASSGRRVYMCPGAVYAARVHMCPGAVCAARVCEKRAIFVLPSNALWRYASERSYAPTYVRPLAFPVLKYRGKNMCAGAVPGVCACVWRGVRERAHARAHVRPRTIHMFVRTPHANVGWCTRSRALPRTCLHRASRLCMCAGWIVVYDSRTVVLDGCRRTGQELAIG
jgi:hypothetical protein